MKKIRTLSSQLKVIQWICGISILVCPFTGLVLIDEGYRVIGYTILFFPVAQLAILTALMFESLIDLRRMKQGKSSFTPLSRLFFPEQRYIEKLFKSGHEKEAIDYARAWIDPDNIPDEERI